MHIGEYDPPTLIITATGAELSYDGAVIPVTYFNESFLLWKVGLPHWSYIEYELVLLSNEMAVRTIIDDSGICRQLVALDHV